VATLGIVISLIVLGSPERDFTVTGYSDVVRFEAAGVSTLQVTIYDLSGKKVWDSGMVSGSSVDWDRNNERGERMAYGAYLYVAQGWEAGGGLSFKKNGKLALMPGDKVQLQQAPVVTSLRSDDTLGPFSDGELTVQPKGLGDTGIFGRVGIGTASPAADLHVAGIAKFQTIAPLNIFQETDQTLPAGLWRLGCDANYFLIDQNTAAAGDFSSYIRRFVIKSNGNVGIGTTSPAANLHVAGVAKFQTIAPLNIFQETDQTLPAGLWRLGCDANYFLIDQNTAAAGGFSSYMRRFVIKSNGNVGIGTTNATGKLTVQATSGDLIAAYNSGDRVFVVKSTGEVRADGAVYAADFNTGSADVAERINVSEWVEPGNVVEIDPEHAGFFRKSTAAYSTKVAGIISTSPGVILGNDFDETTDNWEDNRPVLAVTGRVPCMVSTENGPIAIGDLLVASSTPGIAMKGDSEQATGAVVGKAMEPFEEGEGTIVVQVMLR
jgi:hypothetical protein